MVSKSYNIDITNGTGQENILADTYTISSLTNGYDNTSIIPTSITVDNTIQTFNMTIAATGILTFTVTSTDGTTPIVGAQFIRCDSEGNTYGTAVTTDSNGQTSLDNVPFSATTPVLVYYKQIQSDGNHNFDNTLKNTSLTTNTSNIDITNDLPLQQTFNLTDENYENLKISLGQINLN